MVFLGASWGQHRPKNRRCAFFCSWVCVREFIPLTTRSWKNKDATTNVTLCFRSQCQFHAKHHVHNLWCCKHIHHIRATSHTILRAHDHYTSSTLIGGKGGAGPSSLYSMCEGPTEYVNVRWMQSMHGFLNGIKWIMFHDHLGCYKKPPLGGRPNTKPWDHFTSNAHNHWFILFYHVWTHVWTIIHWNSIWLRARSHRTSHYTWRSVTTLHDFGSVIGWPLDTVFWALTISWSRLLARVWSGPSFLPLQHDSNFKEAIIVYRQHKIWIWLKLRCHMTFFIVHSVAIMRLILHKTPKNFKTLGMKEP